MSPEFEAYIRVDVGQVAAQAREVRVLGRPIIVLNMN
jgi:hypothetical protein